MRHSFYKFLGLLLAALLLAGALPAALAADAAAAPGTLLVMQAETAGALVNGEKAALGGLAPTYSANGTILVPLRPVAQALGAALTWDAAAGTAVMTLDGASLSFPAGGWSAALDGEAVSLTAPAELRRGGLYVPLAALGSMPGLWVHTFNFYEGAVLTLSDYPLTEGDQAGRDNVAYDAAAPDPALEACRDAALAAFGPNAGLFSRTALVLRSGSRRFLVGGAEKTFCDKGGKVLPGNTGGYLMVPLRACAEAMGASYSLGADGASTVVLGERTAVFPAENGHITVDGQRLEHTYFGGALRDGTAYCSVYALTTALGWHGYTKDGGILLSPWQVGEARQRQAWEQAETLPLARYEGAKGFLALTFDDGPSGQFTTRLLDGLKARDVHATFFLCDYRIATFPGLMSRYLSEGHELGNHSANHATLTACSAATLASELDKTNATIRRTAGVSPVLMRPPGGAYNGTVLSAAGQRGMSCIMWSLDTLDWKNRNRDAILQRTLPNVRDGDIILMHDMYASSVDAALSMIDTLQARGYVFVTVSELAQLKGTKLTAGQCYLSLR